MNPLRQPRVRALCAVLIILGMCAGFMGVLFDRYNDQVEDEAVHKVLGRILWEVEGEKILDFATAPGKRKEELGDILRRAVQNGDVNYIIFTDLTGRPIAHSFSAALPPEIGDNLPPPSSFPPPGDFTESKLEWPHGMDTIHVAYHLPGADGYILHVGVPDPVADASPGVRFLQFFLPLLLLAALLTGLAALLHEPFRRFLLNSGETPSPDSPDADKGPESEKTDMADEIGASGFSGRPVPALAASPSEDAGRFSARMSLPDDAGAQPRLSGGLKDFAGPRPAGDAPADGGEPARSPDGQRRETPLAFVEDILRLPGALNVNAAAMLQNFAAAVAAMSEGILVLDGDGRILVCNDALQRLFGLRGQTPGLMFQDVFGREEDRAPGAGKAIYSDKFYYCVLNVGAQLSTEIVLERDGQSVTLYMLVVAVPCGDRKLIICCLKNEEELQSLEETLRASRTEAENVVQAQNRDLVRQNAQLRIESAERSAVAQALRRAESRYRSIFDHATEGIFQWTPDWRLLLANMSFAKMLGYSTVNSLQASLADAPFHFCLSPAVEKEMLSVLEVKGYVHNFELQVARQDGSPLWTSINARRVSGPTGATSFYEAFIENISVRKSAEEKLVHQAFHDPLTGLANRALFQDRLRMALRRASRQSQYCFAVLYMDLDRFKMVNDSFGHNTGDEVLCHAANCILACVRDTDTVARFGGDEFAVLIDDVERASLVVRVAKRIQIAIGEPFFVDGQEINIGASIGIVLRAQAYELPEDLLRDADTAMYRAKADRRIRFKIFSRRMREETLESISFEADLRQGVRNEEFFMEYQPIVNMRTHELHGFEALIRWRRKGQIVSPGQFIPVAEETGLIKPLGDYLLERICRQMARWNSLTSRSFHMHVNISSRQLLYPEFPREVKRFLDMTGINPAWIRFEITESLLTSNGGACLPGIQHLRELGVQFCLDDFGTGFSSLSYLRRLPLDSIKLDRGFVADVETDAQAVSLVRGIAGIGGDLGLAVIVEGIEHNEQAQALLKAGCSLGQGYLFSHPLSAEEAEKLLLQ